MVVVGAVSRHFGTYVRKSAGRLGGKNVRTVRELRGRIPRLWARLWTKPAGRAKMVGMRWSLALMTVALAAGCGGARGTKAPEPPGSLGTTFVTGLPATGLAVERPGKRVELVGLDGHVHARLTGVQLGYVAEPGRLILRQGRQQWLFRPSDGRFVRYSPARRRFRVGCRVGSKPRVTTLFLCSPKPEFEGEFPLPKTIEIERAGSPRKLLARPPFPSPAPGMGPVGHWESALLSPDGRTVLAQWSAECEVPIAFLIPAAGGAPRPVAGTLRKFPVSIAHGWTPDGLAVVSLPTLACGGDYAGPGIYLVSTAAKPLRAIVEGRDIRGAQVWSS